MLSYIFASYLELSLAISLFVLLFLYLIPKKVETYSPKCRAALWMILALHLIIPVQPSTRMPAIKVTAPYQEMLLPGTNLLMQGQASLSLMQVLSIIWVSFAAVIFLQKIILHHCFMRRLLSGTKSIALTDEQKIKTQEIFEQIKKELNAPQNVSLWISSQAQEPMAAGFFSPKVILPDCDFDKQQLCMIFRHELMHICRKDAWYQMVMTTAVSLHWFNPFVYLMAKQSLQELEIACDRSVIAERDEEFAGEYAQTILTTAKQMLRRNTESSAFASGFLGSAQKLKQRLEEILSPARKKGSAFLVFCAVGTLFLTGMVFVQENDQNLDWVQSLRQGNIAQVVLENGEISTSRQDVEDLFSQLSFKPALKNSSESIKSEEFSIVRKDGTKKTVTIFQDGRMRLDGQEYRIYDGFLKSGKD